MLEVNRKKKIDKLTKKIIPVLKRHDVVKAGIFGSFVRGEAKRKSDIDILIKFKGRKSLLDLSRLDIELEKKLRRKVDDVEYGTVHPLLKDRILKEEVRVL